MPWILGPWDWRDSRFNVIPVFPFLLPSSIHLFLTWMLSFELEKMCLSGKGLHQI